MTPIEPRRGLAVWRDEDGEICDTFMADCTCNHDWETHPDTGCLGIDSYGFECECPGYEPVATGEYDGTDWLADQELDRNLRDRPTKNSTHNPDWLT